MDVRDFRGSLLTTSSALALAVGLGGPAAAAGPCTFSNQAGGVNNTGAANCITFNNEQGGTANGNFSGATTFTGNVINSGTITPTGVNQNWPAGLAGTDAGISVIGPGVTLTGNITNSGTITGTTAQFAGINIGGGGGGSGAPGATVVGSITNAGSITSIPQGILVSGVGTVVTGSVINLAGASIINSPTAGGPGLSVTNHASVGGSVVNSGTINTLGTGLQIEGATVAGDVSNGGAITIHNGFTAMALVNGSEGPGRVGGSVINTGTITNLNATTNIALWVQGQTIAGGITNTASITGGFGIYVSAFSNGALGGATVGGNVTNSGNIVANTNSGIGIHGATVRGALINSGSITAAGGGGIVLGTTSGVSAKGSIAGGITNTGKITAKTGIAVVNGAILSGGITNTGTISALGTGILLTTAGVSIFDSGIIAGGGGTAIQFGGGTNTLTLGPGFSIAGNVLGAGADVLQLAGTGNGSFNLSSIGSQYTGFGTFGVISATWTATGANSGNWSISNGATLQLGNGATSGLITGNLADGGVLSFNEPSGTTATVPGVISGTGSLTQVGPGTVVLSGSNLYSGGTTLSAGTLQVTNGSSVGTGMVTLDGGTFQSGAAGLSFANKFAINTTGGTIDTQANTLTLSGSIANGNGTTGPLNKAGGGTLILTGMSSYTGPTNVNAGTLQAGANNVFAPASIFTVASGAFLAFNNFNQTLGSLAGAGGVTLGTGALTLANASGVFSGAITGSGTFTLQTGTETLTGNDSGFTGTALLTGGNFIVGTATSPGAVFGGSVTVQNGGTLSGHGTILGSVNNAGGTVSPGGSVGTLSVGGNYVQGANGTLAIQLTPAAASQLAVQGSASLAGTLAAMPSAGLYVPKTKYPILTAGGGVSGTFGTFTNTLPSLNLTISYLSNEVDLVVGGFAGQTRNQIAVANALNLGLGTATGDFATALTAVAALPPAQLPQTLSSLGGQIYANLGEVSLQDRRLFLGAMDERMRLLGGGSPGAATLGGLVPGGWGNNTNAMQMAALGSAIGDQGPQVAQAGGTAPGAAALPNNVWARGFGQFGSLDSNKGALGADYSTGGGAIGTEIVHTPGSLLGLAISGGQSSVSTQSLPENGTVSFVQFGVYGAQAYDYGLMADGALAYAHDFYDVSRGLVGLGRTATSSHGGNDAALDVGVSRPMQVDAWRITPRVGLSYFHIGQSSFAENGANSLDLSVSPTAIDALRSRVGVTLSQPMMLGGNQILPELRAAWTHDFLDDRGVIGAAFAGAPGLGFTQIGAATGRDAADLGVGVSFAVAQTAVPGQLSAFLQYDATVAAHQTSNAVAGGLKLTW